jgi:hypothetical protein
MYDNLIQNPHNLDENTIHKLVCKLCNTRGERNYQYLRGRHVTLVRTTNKINEAVGSSPSLQPEADYVYEFSTLVHAVVRGHSGEHEIPIERIPPWITERLRGYRLISLKYERLALTRIGKHEAGRARPILFTGTVKVTDVNVATKTWRDGIGRLKAFGYGMLNLKQPQSNQT